jgi:hypothetical protein
MKTYQSFGNVLSGLLGLILVATSCSRKTDVGEWWDTSDLKEMNLPIWQVTNAIPLTPDKAVLAATHYLSTNYVGFGVFSWQVDNLALYQEDSSNWTYTMTLTVMLTNHFSSHTEFPSVKVLMDGNVWKPSHKQLNQ